MVTRHMAAEIFKCLQQHTPFRSPQTLYERTSLLLLSVTLSLSCVCDLFFFEQARMQIHTAWFLTFLRRWSRATCPPRRLREATRPCSTWETSHTKDIQLTPQKLRLLILFLLFSGDGHAPHVRREGCAGRRARAILGRFQRGLALQPGAKPAHPRRGFLGRTRLHGALGLPAGASASPESYKLKTPRLIVVGGLS